MVSVPQTVEGGSSRSAAPGSQEAESFQEGCGSGAGDSTKVDGADLASSPPTELELALGHHFADRALLDEALTHPSYANVQAQRGLPVRDNQRLEFLGDAVVDLCVSERLFDADPDAREGALTERRAGLVNEARLADAARALGLGRHLKLAPGEERSGFRERASVLADALEALAAAIYRDAGLCAARAFVLRALPELEVGRPERLKPAKARLQELTQQRWKLTPSYATQPADGDDVVVTEVRVGDRLCARGEGSSRRDAENRAAHAALSALTSPKRS